MKVLIVDDSEEMRTLLVDYLPAEADEVHQCADGMEACSAFKAILPDWVLMDHQMPRMNGIAAIRKIVAEFPKAKICVVTAFDEEELRLEALSAGAAGFVAKSRLFELETILRKGTD